jgi:hypothetical protein
MFLLLKVAMAKNYIKPLTQPQIDAALVALETRLKKEMHDSYALKIIDYEMLVKTLENKVEELEKLVNKAPAVTAPSNAWNLIVSKNVAKTQEQIDIINTVTKENKERLIINDLLLRNKNVLLLLSKVLHARDILGFLLVKLF